MDCKSPWDNKGETFFENILFHYSIQFLVFKNNTMIIGAIQYCDTIFTICRLTQNRTHFRLIPLHSHSQSQSMETRSWEFGVCNSMKFVLFDFYHRELSWWNNISSSNEAVPIFHSLSAPLKWHWFFPLQLRRIILYYMNPKILMFLSC